MNKKNKTFIGLILAMIIAASFFCVFFKYKSGKSVCKDCNVILISLDTLGAKHMPCYGYDKNTMPILCSYAKENILFQNSYSMSYWTLPSHMSIFTGLYPTTHKVLSGIIDSLDPKYKTITEVLKTNNYNTLYFGPTSDINMPLDKGIGSGFDYVEKEYDLNSWEKGLQMLENNQMQNKKTFLFLHTYRVHYPYLPQKKEKYQFVDLNKATPKIIMSEEEYYRPDEDFINFVINEFKERLKIDGTKESREYDQGILNYLTSNKTLADKFEYLNKTTNNTYRERWQINNIKTQSNLEFYRSLYDEQTYNLDKFLGDFLYKIKSRKIDKNTIIIITSDHGEGFYEHNEFDHCGDNPDCLYNEITKVPLIMSIPGVKNKVIKNVVQGIDIYPTILSYLGIEKPLYVEGMDLKSLINNIFFKVKHKYVVSEQGFKGKVIVDEKWKLYIKNMEKISNPDSIMLFDLANDKDEKNDLSKINNDKVSEMRNFAIDFSRRPGGEKVDISTKKIPSWLDEAGRKRLLENGYF